MLSAVELPLIGLAAMVSMMAVLWLVQRRTGDAGIVDVGWAAGLGVLAVLYALLGPGDPIRRAIVGVLAGAWSARLALYLLFNRVIGKPEDGRYQDLRRSWGERFQSKLFLFFQAQGVLDVVLSASFLAVASTVREGLGVADVVGVTVWLVAVGGEAIADRQLSAFRADPANRGRTCRGGLWRYSRHPNYFFEWVHWLAYVPLAWGSPWVVATLPAPAIMLFLVLRVTGIPPTEAQALRSRGDDYRAYQRTTSAFFPLPPRRVLS